MLVCSHNIISNCNKQHDIFKAIIFGLIIIITVKESNEYIWPHLSVILILDIKTQN